MAAEVIATDFSSTSTASTCRPWSASTSARPRRTCAELFDAAEDGGAILFFDEADALFGKRSEVKDSHDRYANIEINYLLQRMEAYRGLAILATNMKSALDPAFLRRLRFIVDFPFPGAGERTSIWQRVFPPACPGPTAWTAIGSARLNLTGGNIHNIAMNAAFLAARDGRPRYDAACSGIRQDRDPQAGTARQRARLRVGRHRGVDTMTRRLVIDVERIVVHDVELTGAERIALDGAFRAELERLLAPEPPPVRGGRGYAAAVLRPDPLPLPAGREDTAVRLGTAVARSVFQGLASIRRGPR